MIANGLTKSANRAQSDTVTEHREVLMTVVARSKMLTSAPSFLLLEICWSRVGDDAIASVLESESGPKSYSFLDFRTSLC